MPLNWLEEITDVSSAGLTVQAQALSIDDIDPNRMLRYPVFFPYMPTPSVKLQTIFETDYRPVADRREWNAPGRYVPDVLPELEDLEMLPVESEDRLGEQEMQAINEQALGNEQVYKDLAMLSVPQKMAKLVASNHRRMEFDAMEAWAKGTITVKNHTKGDTAQTFSLGFSSSRITTAGTAWDDGGVDAYDLFLQWIEDGEEYVGEIVGVHMTRAIFRAIQADAPNPVPGISQTVRPTLGAIQQLVASDFGKSGFSILLDKGQGDVFTDGGTARTRTKVWPAQYAAAIPAGGVIGATYRAPNGAAIELARANPDASIEMDGMAVVNEFENAGKFMRMRCQANWLSLPQERNVCTINTGVS